MCFPVCREWKLLPPWGLPRRQLSHVHMCFPVCREWKRTIPEWGQHSCSQCTCAFPFAGNGNKRICIAQMAILIRVHMCFPVCREWKLVTLFPSSFLLLSCTCAFPFAGNGNLYKFTDPSPDSCECTCAFPFAGNGNSMSTLEFGELYKVHMCFPVCREWKQEMYWEYQ